MNWKILVPVVAIIVLAVILIFPAKTPEQEKLSQTPIQNEAVNELVLPTGGEEQSIASLPPATDNLDDYVTALIQDSLDEQTATEEAMANDFSLIDTDTQAISDFGQSYGEDGI